MHSDCLLKLQISLTLFAVHLRGTCMGLVPENIVIVAGMNELKSSFCAIIIISLFYNVV